jgi:hypothetical protein
MDSDSESYGWSFDEQAHSDYNRECKLFGYDEDRWFWEEQEEERRQAQRLSRAYDELNAAPRDVVAKRRCIHGPTNGAELSLVSLGPAPLSVAFSFLHPVELSRVEMTAKALRTSVDAVWRFLFDERIRGCRSSYPRERQYSAKECRRAVVLEECWLNFRSDLGQLNHMAGCPPYRPPHQFRSGSLSDLILQRYIFFREQFEDSSKPLPSECECGEVNRAWCQLFPDRPLRCRRCKEFELALECIDMATDVIGSETEVDRDEALSIALWEKEHGVG